MSTNISKCSTCWAANVYIFVYILIGTLIVPLNPCNINYVLQLLNTPRPSSLSCLFCIYLQYCLIRITPYCKEHQINAEKLTSIDQLHSGITQMVECSTKSFVHTVSRSSCNLFWWDRRNPDGTDPWINAEKVTSEFCMKKLTSETCLQCISLSTLPVTRE